jgi:hypothetical protein
MTHSGYGNGMMQVAMHSSKGRTKTKGEGILLPSPPKNKIACLNKRKAQASNADLVSNCVLLLEFKRLIQENKN